MPVYNGEEYVRDALDSLLAQTYANFELIISDNASTDKTEQICRGYAARDARIRYVRQPENRGAAANFQFVLDEAVGAFFMWAAYDDYWKPNFITHALKALDDESTGFAFPTFAVKSIHLHIFKKFSRNIFLGFEENDSSSRVLHFANLHQSSHKGNLVYSLFRTALLKKAYAIQDISDEYVLSMILLKTTRGIILNECNFYKRYPKLWPGFRKKLLIKTRKRKQFEKIRDAHYARAKSVFPELQETLELIRLNHVPSNYLPGYKIISNLLTQQ